MQTNSSRQSRTADLKRVSIRLTICLALILSMLNVGFVNAMSQSDSKQSDPTTVTFTDATHDVEATHQIGQSELATIQINDFQYHDLHEDSESDPLLFVNAGKNTHNCNLLRSYPTSSLIATNFKPLLRPPIFRN